jgi:hypothetical protein
METKKKQYKGHQIELREIEDSQKLFIDDIEVKYGQLPNGKYYLHGNAYDWADDLIALAQKSIEQKSKIKESQNKPHSKTKGK